MKRYTRWSLGIIIFLMLLSGCTKEEAPPVIPGSPECEVWLHRVNNFHKGIIYFDKYTGFEIDVHFDTATNLYYVKHDFSDTIRISFRDWLDSIPGISGKGLWLDFKNLDTCNNERALAELVKIRNDYNLKDHTIIVESSDPAASEIFDTLNFRISYYIPAFDPQAITEEKELYYKNFISVRVDSFDLKTISGSMDQYEFMTKWFPDLNKLTWFLDVYNPSKRDSVTKICMKDPEVRVLLLSEEFEREGPLRINEH